MEVRLEAFEQKARNRKKENQAFYRKLKARPPADLDRQFHELHDEVFAHTDCLNCANCCKTTSPVFYEKDIARAAKYLKLKPGEFTDRYLRLDEDKDYVPNSIPCPFLQQDNHCRIYEARPLACREYPHTNRKKMQQILDLTFRNTLVCPAVLEITEKLSAQLPKH